MTVSINTSFSIGLREKLGEEKLIALFAEAGYDAIELSLDQLSDEESIWNQVGHKEYAQRLKAAAQAAGIRFNQAHAPSQFDWMARDTDVLNAMVYPAMEKAFEICSILEIPCMVIEPLIHPMALGLPSRRTSWNTTFFKTLTQMGQKYGVRVAIKNLMRSFERGEELNTIMDAVDAENFGACDPHPGQPRHRAAPERQPRRLQPAHHSRSGSDRLAEHSGGSCRHRIRGRLHHAGIRPRYRRTGRQARF